MMDALLVWVFASQWQVVVIVSALLLVLTELGFNLGRRLHRTGDEARKGQIGGIQAALLGMLGLLIGFTFAMAAGRYEIRRNLVLDEANAIATTYLRASFLPDGERFAVEELLQKYIAARLRFYAAGADTAGIDAAERESAEIQHELWTHTVAAARQAPTPLVATFVNSLNQMIDLDAMRMNAQRNHVPSAVWLLLLVVAACGSCATGYSAGTTGNRTGFGNFVLPLLIAVVIAIVADLDRPRLGIIGVDQRPLLDLQNSLERTTTP